MPHEGCGEGGRQRWGPCSAERGQVLPEGKAMGCRAALPCFCGSPRVGISR